MKKRRKWKLDPARPYLTSLSLCNATSCRLMSFAFRRNTIVCLLEHLGNRQVCCWVAFLLGPRFRVVLCLSFCESLYFLHFLFPLLPYLFFIDFSLSFTFIPFPCVVSHCESVLFILYIQLSWVCIFSLFLVFMFLSSFTSVFPCHFHFSLRFRFLFFSSFLLYISRLKISFSLPFTTFFYFLFLFN